MYHNYHKHDHYGNPWTMDVVVKPEDYCKRALELGHTTVFTTNHGVTGNIFEWLDLSKKYGLKLIYGTEAYYVKDRFEKDRNNRHLIVIAKNNDGAMQLNDIMTEAHSTGFYYKPRIDYDLVMSLNPDNFVITTACVGGIWDDAGLILALHRKFKSNFFLEVQAHDVDVQKAANRKLLDLSRNAGIPIIHANDSHYIYPDDAKYRKILLNAKEIHFQEEDGMILDYPDEDEIYRRYKKQGVLTREEVADALKNTLVFDSCDEITFINDDVKLPAISEHPMEDLRAIIRENWKRERQHIPKEEWKKYTDAICYELDIVDKTNMANYFLIDYKIAKDGQEKYGGKLTNTGRGSAPSFYITKLLGLTDIDRISSPITLFPTRFMSVERIISSRSLPDIDLNMADREPFIRATEDLLGKENCAWMISWKPLQDSSALRLYCRGIGMHVSEYDEVAKNIELYENDNKWGKIIAESRHFVGMIESISESPCSELLYDKPIRKELGLVRTSKDKMCCLLDGYNCDKYKYLKNDYLSVIVWSIIRSVCNLAGIPIPTIRELDNLLDDQTFEIYEKGLTSTINQADSDFATQLLKRYKPKSVAEMSAFVAIIRPGCASLLQDFIDRKPYTTGVDELDKILAEGNHRMIYQELIMRYLIWLGIAETGSYDIIKKIAKKKFKEDELAELKTKLLEGWKRRVGKEDGFDETWQIVENAARYSFNACVSGDTLIQRAGLNKKTFNPTVEEMYLIKNDADHAIKTGHYDLHKKYCLHGYGNALSMFDDGRIRKNRIVDIRQSGIADIYMVTTDNGSFIDCTMNHKFPTPSGKKELSELKIGDLLYTKDKYKRRSSIHKIVSIEYLRTDQTYDIEMESPAHTFVSSSGLVVSNSHSLSYAYDSLYGAYLKSHYPLEYYTVALNYYDDDSKRTAKLTEELSAFGIKLKPIRFRFSRSDYSLSKEDNSIYKGIKSIKDMSADAAEDIYSLRDNHYDSFIDLLKDINEKTCAKKNQIRILIELDFFEEFGDANLLLAQFDFYEALSGRSQFKKEFLINDCKIPHDTIMKYAGKETEKLFTKVDSYGLILEFAKNIPYRRRTLKEKISSQVERLGYINIIDPRYSGMVVVLELDTTYSPKVKLYSLKNGTISDCKIDRKTFNRAKVAQGDILKIICTQRKPKVKKNADTGEWENVPGTSELWITKYHKVENL